MRFLRMIVNLTHLNWRTSLLVWFVLIIGTVVASDTTWAQEEVSENPAEQTLIEGHCDNYVPH
mgnify:CR=1 FL=1